MAREDSSIGRSTKNSRAATPGSLTVWAASKSLRPRLSFSILSFRTSRSKWLTYQHKVWKSHDNRGLRLSRCTIIAERSGCANVHELVTRWAQITAEHDNHMAKRPPNVLRLSCDYCKHNCHHWSPNFATSRGQRSALVQVQVPPVALTRDAARDAVLATPREVASFAQGASGNCKAVVVVQPNFDARPTCQLTRRCLRTFKTRQANRSANVV